MIVQSEFIFESAPFPSCHASTIVETKSGLVAAWFGGTKERDPDVGIWVSRHIDGKWSDPVEVANGLSSTVSPPAARDLSPVNGHGQDARATSTRQPCWNPVLFQPRERPLMLFYKVGPSPSKWWGMVCTSNDDGQSWSDPTRLPDGILGPIKNKPVQFASGDILSPSSVEGADIGWRTYFERSKDGGRTWTASDFVDQDASIKAIQPSILIHSETKLQAIGRTKSARMFDTWSDDAGRSWSKLALLDLPNPNSGTDAVTLRDGRHLLVYNHSAIEKVRVPLNVAVSRDGKQWDPLAVLEDELTFESGELFQPDPQSPRKSPRPDQYSYPAVIQSADGLVHVTYTWKRKRIKHTIIEVK
jgi:predicted neuraminidase